ncbi:MAG: YdcH family protein [Defluviimonas sp.]|uniref:YdcH family protein n=1 Tax=Albidovulum sp. TaxID=1872424 RepID=UPI001D58B31F|nr:YdcH family protein [Paracoccaceae bacterium]MCC0064560.1 YdcH family protein [Defluviimonas sp.]
MNAPMEMDDIEVMRVKLEVLRQEHRDLDAAIHLMEGSGRADQLTMKRLKKQKLMLKDQIARLDDLLTPDIIA